MVLKAQFLTMESSDKVFEIKTVTVVTDSDLDL